MGNAESSSKVPAKSIIKEQKEELMISSTKNVNTNQNVINNSKKSQPVQNKIYISKSTMKHKFMKPIKLNLVKI